MADDAKNQSEDAAFLSDKSHVLGPRALTALNGIRDQLGLDYAGVDFSLSTSGDVILFEANATMVVNPPDADRRWGLSPPRSSTDSRRYSANADETWPLFVRHSKMSNSQQSFGRTN